jgi:hypothetical protein
MMAMKRWPRSRVVRALNKHFSKGEIETTARKLRQLPERAELGSLSRTLGIIPQHSVKEWRRSSGSVPALIAAALTGGIRNHLRSLKGKRGAREIRFRIVDGDRFALRIVERDSYMSVTLTMRNKPFRKSRA